MRTQAQERTRKAGGIRAISRAAKVLRALKDDGGLSLGEIASRIALPRSTVQRLVDALIDEGLVVASSAEGGLRLGPEIQSLAAASRIAVADLVRPVLEELSQKTGETVDIAVFRDDHMLFIDQVVGTHRLRAVSAVGEVFPMTTTANGKAALALLDDEAVDAIAARELEGRGAGKKAIRPLRAEIDRVREAGFALDLDEHTEGISAVGVAFHTPTGLIYAISIPVPSQRFGRSRDALAEDLLDALESVRAVLEGSGSQADRVASEASPEVRAPRQHQGGRREIRETRREA
jgi:DNA-binding IclR family transcriptional regulator